MDTASSSGPIFSGSLSFTLDVRILSELFEGTRCHLVSPCRLLYMWPLQKDISSTRSGYLSMRYSWYLPTSINMVTNAFEQRHMYMKPTQHNHVWVLHVCQKPTPMNDIGNFEQNVIIIIIIYTTYIAPYIWPVWPFIGAEEGPSKYWSQAMLRGCPGFRVLTYVSLHTWQLSVDHIGPMTIAYWLPFHCHSQIDG